MKADYPSTMPLNMRNDSQGSGKIPAISPFSNRPLSTCLNHACLLAYIERVDRSFV
jgi:hypothetical protein